MKRFFLAAPLFLSCALVAFLPLGAQETDGSQGANDDANNTAQNSSAKTIPYWKAVLPGGEYIVKLSAIEAVSSQQYTVDGVARVTEVNVVTSGIFQPRFYYIERVQVKTPIDIPGAQTVVDRAQVMAEEILNQSTSEDHAWKKVVKNYPTTTHAGTIEFRLDTLQQIQRIARSAERAWITGRGEIFAIDRIRPFTPDEAKKHFEEEDEQDSEPKSSPGGN